VLTSAAAGRKGAGAARAAILGVARRLYVAHGASGISARKIARELGCSPTAIYLYYRSIPDIIEHLRMEGHALLAARLRRVSPKLPALECIRAMGRAYWRFALEHRGYYALMFTLRAAETPGREAVQREMATLFILRGIKKREMRRDLDPTVVTNVLWAKIHGVAALAVSGLLVQTAPGHREEVLEAMLESATRWLAP